MPTTRQTRRATGGHSGGSGAGIGVDSYGGPVIDPTENVLAYVDKAIQRQDDLREAETKRQDDLREAETRRVNEKASQKQEFDLEIARILRANVEEKSLLLATQLKEVKADLQVELRSLNQFRWESGGKSTARGDVWGYVVGAAGFAAALTVVVTFLLKH